MLQLPPLSLYIHFPWCVAKCPYCDFNSHALNGELPESGYIDALLADLELELPRVWGRTVQSIFLGGGTPSLFSAAAMDRLLSGVRARLTLSPEAEITMEANPGTVEHDRFEDYRSAGINRISLGIQSFNDHHLKSLGRIHGGQEASAAIGAVRKAGFENFNLDLMWALPGQSLSEALADVDQALSFEPAHVSHYHLTIEPNTVFAARPPSLPDEDSAWDMQDACAVKLNQAGFQQYEVSAWSRPGAMSRHNLNYWTFGDYLGIGAGAHGKLSDLATGAIQRLSKTKNPAAYLRQVTDADVIADSQFLQQAELPLEFMLNAARLLDGVPASLFSERTGLPVQALEPQLTQARARGLLEPGPERLQPTALGWRFLNELLESFVPE